MMERTEPPKLHHVGIIQPDFEAAEAYMKVFGHEEAYRGFVEEFECWCLFCEAPLGAPAVELVVPTGGSLARFNKGAGGLHHYAYEVDDLVSLQTEYTAKDQPMLFESPIKGAGNFMCNFLNPIVTRGTVIEFVQPI